MGHDLSPSWSSRGTPGQLGCPQAAGLLFQASAPGEEQGAAGPPHPRLWRDDECRWVSGPRAAGGHTCPQVAAALLTGTALAARLLGLLPLPHRILPILQVGK